MSNTLKNSDLSRRPALRTLLAISLCATMAAFGCTTDRSLGNGDPVVTPGSRSTPTGGATTGTETESVPPPMMSSYSGAQVLPSVRPRISREEAALLLTEMQPRVRVLGLVSPGPGGRTYASDLIGQRLQQVETRSTINSTIYSPPVEGILSGAGEPVAGVSTNVGTAVNASSTVSTTATPTGTAIASPSALASVRTLSPTAAAVVNPPASISSSPVLATESSSRTAAGATVQPGTVQAVSSQSVTTPSATTSATVANPVRVVTTNGRLTVTNIRQP